MLSKCCKADLTVFTGSEGTNHWICSRCAQPADPVEYRSPKTYPTGEPQLETPEHLVTYIGILASDDQEWFDKKSYKQAVKHVKEWRDEAVATAQADQRRYTAAECYLETLAVGCGESEYSEAIKSKFNLKGSHE